MRPISAFLIATGIVFSLPATAQNQHPETLRPVHFKTVNLKDQLVNKSGFTASTVRDENGLIGVPKKTAVIHPFDDNSRNGQPDPVWQNDLLQQRATAATATAGQNFNGLGYTSVNPADPVSATGPNHTIQMINASGGSLVRISNKTGTQVVSDFLFSNITGVQGAGDPIVLYDQLAGRWLLNEFGRSNGVTSYINTLIFAISATDDPTGSWYVYAFADNSFFVDYQKIAIWHNAYFATSNDFNTAGTSYLGSSIYAFDRTKMLNGDPTATAIRSRQTHPTGRYFSMAPVTQEGLASSSLSGQFCFYQNDAWTGDPGDVDSLYTFTFTPDFNTPANSVISVATQMAIAALDDDLCTAGRETCINQQGSGTALEALTGRIMNKVIFRKFPTYESAVLCATVDANGSGLAGVRWWEIRRTTGAWSLYQEGTYSPDANHRFMGSIGQDARGNIGLIYNVSGTTEHPSIRVTGRNPCDPLGTMTAAELTIIDGTAANGSTRYGDYNSVSIDPTDNLTFWITGMYNSSANWSTRMASFTLDNCAPTPLVRFQQAALSLLEKDQNVTSGCLNYKDYTVNVVIDAAPSADAIVTFNTSGTASTGTDYTITPASVTLNAANLSRTLTIRVFDDGAIENAETLSIGYTINNSGGNAAADNYNQTCTVNIIDNDIAPLGPQTVTATWGGTSVGTITSGPFNGSAYTDKRLQNLYYGTDMISAGLKAGTITNLEWNFGSTAVATFNNMTVRIGFVSNTVNNLSTGFQAPVFTTIYTGNFTTPGTTGWYNFTLPTPVNWNGTDNIIIETCWDNAATTTDVALAGMNETYNASTLVRQNGAGSLCSSLASNLSVARPAIRLTAIVPGTNVAGSLTSKSSYLGPLMDVPFYNASGDIIARVKNLTSFDYGCTTVEIDRAGTGATAFWNSSSANYLTTKTVRVVPTNANPTGQYEITLYYNAAEKTGFETAATPTLWNSVQLVKTNGPISGITPASPQPSTVFINSAVTHGTLGTNYTVKGTFTNGFSGFAVGQPGFVLPVTFTDFNGRKNGEKVELDWITGSEINNKHFEIETAKGNDVFYKIGTVISQGPSVSSQYYDFTDPLPARGVNHYRLKQVDHDGKISYSRTVSVIFDGPAKIFTIFPNPAKEQLSIRFASPVEKVALRILSTDGKTVQTNFVNSIQRQYELPVHQLASGLYILELTYDGEKNFIRFVKE